MLAPSPGFVLPGDTAWQLTAATLVGLMSIPGLAVLYGGLVPRRSSLNAAFMVFYAFAAVLVVWGLWAYRMGFGSPWALGPGIWGQLVGTPGPVLSGAWELGQAHIPLLSSTLPSLRMPASALVYFQAMFAAIAPCLLVGTLLGRMRPAAWMVFVPVWTTLVYAVNAFWLWGGGWLAQLGAVDYSGGYVIHVAAGVSGFVASWVVGGFDHDPGPRGREPGNLLLSLVGAGILWLGWNGFNGGDSYFAGANAGAAVWNTNLAAAMATLTWMVLDVARQSRPTLLGTISGMVSGLVAITPAAGYVNGYGALVIGVLAAGVAYLTMQAVRRIPFLARVEDPLGVLHTHGVAGAVGGLLTGVLADPHVVVYPGLRTASVAVRGLLYGDPRQLWIQLVALLAITAYDALMTLGILKGLRLVMVLRTSRAEQELGDQLLHGERAQALEHEHAPLARPVAAFAAMEMEAEGTSP